VSDFKIRNGAKMIKNVGILGFNFFLAAEPWKRERSKMLAILLYLYYL
jgi:hypothetical protein